MPQECLCDRCTALCCRYFALQIDKPKAPADYDDIRWYLMHENVHVFIEDGDWYLAVQTRCQNLRDDNKCGVYEDRPKICRQYTTDNCDFYLGEYEFEQYFTTAEQLEAYAHAKLGKRYERYVLRQRLRNIGLDPRKVKKGHPRRPSTRDVVAARKRPRIKGHPSAHRHGHGAPSLRGAGAAGALVQLSISA